jgi:hypothetical protein
MSPRCSIRWAANGRERYRNRTSRKGKREVPGTAWSEATPRADVCNASESVGAAPAHFEIRSAFDCIDTIPPDLVTPSSVLLVLLAADPHTANGRQPATLACSPLAQGSSVVKLNLNALSTQRGQRGSRSHPWARVSRPSQAKR